MKLENVMYFVEGSCVVELEGSSLEEVRVKWMMDEYKLDLDWIMEEKDDWNYSKDGKMLGRDDCEYSYLIMEK